MTAMAKVETYSVQAHDKPLRHQIALITGASKGIGAAVAQAYAAAGAEVILVGRCVEDLEHVDDTIRKYGITPLLVPMDICQSDLIEQLAKTVATRYGYLDILVGNAGYLHKLTPLTHLSPQEWDKTFQINLTANWQLLRWFEPLLQRSPNKGRIIFVTAEVAHPPQAYWGAYALSKAALENMVTLYNQENTGLQVNIIDPGTVQTNLRLTAMPGEQLAKVPISVTDLFVAAAHPLGKGKEDFLKDK